MSELSPEIEARAAAVLADVPEWIWDGKSVPVPVEVIVDDCFGLLVRDVEEMTTAPECPPLAEGQSISGLLLADEGQIWVNAHEARQWPPRRRFTIAHELGHWVLHRAQQRSLFCRHGAVEERLPSERPPLDPIEEEANHFAASLLMPGPLVREHYKACGGDFEALCDRFGSSGAAMGRRLHQVI